MTPEAPTDMTHVDGNAVVGALSVALGVDAAGATVECAGCGHDHLVEQAHVYLRCPGIVARCPSCGNAEVVLVEIEHRFTVTLGGAAALRFAPRGTVVP
jgi:hypothetical protein